jgi:hypothetical protein
MIIASIENMVMFNFLKLLTLIKVKDYRTFLSLLTGLHQTYLIIDALDECSEREELLDIITEEIMPLGHANLLVTSRMGRDIEERLYSSVEVKIGLEGQKTDADINLYVQNWIKNDRQLQKWASPVQREI